MEDTMLEEAENTYPPLTEIFFLIKSQYVFVINSINKKHDYTFLQHSETPKLMIFMLTGLITFH